MNFQNKVFIFLGGILLLITISLNSYSQLNSSNLTQFTENDGLPGAQVNKLLIDKRGYIWAGTINGLARFDGYGFKRFYSNPNDTSSIHGLIIWSLFEDHTGQIWIGNSPSFLNIYNPVLKTFRQLDFAQLVNHAANTELIVAAMCEDKKGRVYFGIDTYLNEKISSALLYKDEKDDIIKRFITPDSLEIRNVISMTKDKTGNVWLLSRSGLFKIDNGGRITRTRLMDKELEKNHELPTDIKVDSNGHVLLISTASRLYDFDPAANTYTTWLSDKLVTKPLADIDRRVMAIDNSNNIWFETSTGVQYFNRKTGKFSMFNSGIKKELEHLSINDLAVDSFGTLWIATSTDGLIKYENKTQLNSYIYNKEDKNSITSGWANFIYEAYDGNIWIGTSGSAVTSGINVLDSRTGVLTPIPFSRFSGKLDGVFSLWEKAPGELYVAGFKKLFLLSEKTFQLKPVLLPGAPDTLSIIYHLKDSRANEWLCTLTGLFKKDKGSPVFRRYDLSKVSGGDASSNQVTKAYESKKHGLWLTTDNGLFLYNYDNDAITRQGFDKTKGDVFVTQDINSFYEDDNGIAWVGPWQGGLSRYNVETKKIFTYTRNDGLPSMSVQSILPDAKNNSLWLSTFEGLSRFNIKTQQFNNFSIADGIQGQLFADGSSLKTAKGLLVFGGSNGISIFNPDDIDKKSVPPMVFLTDLRVSNKPVIPGKNSFLKNPLYATEQIILPHKANNIAIEFSALHYSNPAKNRISYKLENYDEEWRDAGGLHVASYPNLPSGEYIFHVKAANDKGVWNQHGASLKIIIRLPWWRTTLAYIIYALIVACIIFFINRYFHRRLLQKERQKSQARELEQAKEIEKAYHKLAESHEALQSTQAQLIQSEKMASLGQLTSGIAHEIRNPLNFVNNFSEVNNDLIDELTSELHSGNHEEALLIAKDIKENEQKINHHGKRADAIVAGMLQHSGKNTGVKELTDINALAEECLRLSLHGIRTKNKDFTAVIQTVFDENLSARKGGIGKINIVPQDIGRVLINLFNNAFYAVKSPNPLKGAHYEPTVSVSTKAVKSTSGNLPAGRQGLVVLLTVTDNGNGIPQNIIDKIFQPFFTTKPAGEGTGLGLSLSYDIVKAHGGEIKVKSKENEGTEFIITLPV